MEASNREYSQHYSEALMYRYEEHDYDFLSHKVANIHDDLPHLIHADHVQERGNESTADFIRKVTEGRSKEPDKFKIQHTIPNNLSYAKYHKMEAGFVPEFKIGDNTIFPATLHLRHFGSNVTANKDTLLTDPRQEHYIYYEQYGTDEELQGIYKQIREELDKHDE